MPYDKLLGQRRIKPYRAKPREVEQLLRVAARDLTTAEKILPEDLDWAFNIVYNAVLQAGRALMLHRGFRSRGPEQHRTVVRFCELALGSDYKRRIALFDQMRRKRNRLVYEEVAWSRARRWSKPWPLPEPSWKRSDCWSPDSLV